MRVTVIGVAWAAATVAQAGVGDFLKPGMRQLGRRLNSEVDTAKKVNETECADHPGQQLDKRANSKQDKAAEANKSKSSSLAAAVKSKAAAL